MKTALKFDTGFKELSTEALLKISRIVEVDFLKPYRKTGWRSGQYLATSPWPIMLPIQYELDQRKKKARPAKAAAGKKGGV